jgi:hypothetical protein
MLAQVFCDHYETVETADGSGVEAPLGETNGSLEPGWDTSRGRTAARHEPTPPGRGAPAAGGQADKPNLAGRRWAVLAVVPAAQFLIVLAQHTGLK